MATKTPVLGYIERKSVIHELNAITKLFMVIVASLAVMIGFDTRFLALMTVASFTFWAISKISIRDMMVVIWLIVIFMILNNIAIFIFAPGYGHELYGTEHPIFHIWGPYTITQEQLFYQLNVTLKYFAITPIALIFIATTPPSEFASAVNRIGISYYFAYAVSLTLRYIPDVQREFREISQAQQAKGIDTSKDTKLLARMRNAAALVFPLFQASLERIETISTAMELRGFGKSRRRTWYRVTPLQIRDWVVMAGALALLSLGVALLWVNGGRFYNPFI